MLDKHITIGVIDILFALIITLMSYFVAISFDKYSGNFSSDYTLIEKLKTNGVDIPGNYESLACNAIIIYNNYIELYKIRYGKISKENNIKTIIDLFQYINNGDSTTYIIYETEKSELFSNIIRYFSLNGISVGIGQVAK